MNTAQPEVREGRSLNPVWFIPVLALALGAYMVVHTWLTEGPEITIAFDTAEGLEAGKTKIKYRNVEVGLITEVELTDDYQGVLARAKMDIATKPLLREDTRFWVVTARIGLGAVSGLDTLLSGAYIQLEPGNAKKAGADEFVALPRPPLTPEHAPGLRLRLLSQNSPSVTTGDPVLYKGYRVGRVESADFDVEEERMRYQIFIDAPFHELVDSAVRFWNASGVSVIADAEGVKLRTSSLDTVLLGGIAFGRPPDVPEGQPVEAGSEFQLYDTYEETLEDPFRHGAYVVVRFNQSIKGLLPGAPVEYRGIRMGRVERILIRELIAERTDTLERYGSIGSEGQPVPVLLYIEPGRFTLPDTPESVDLMRRIFASGVPSGLRASMETGNLLTGAKYIGFDYYPEEAGKAEMGEWQGYPVIPVIGSGVEQIMVKINAILEQVSSAPIEQTIANTNAAVQQLERALESLDAILRTDATKALPAELEATMAEMRKTMQGLSPDSELYQNLNASMRQLNRTMANLEDLTSTLSDKPNAAVFGSKLPPDPQPEASRQ
ncbi:MAG: intermembrane transport protein PqiB [Halieaceae bacterium]|jgi:paraquat-inducible protein B|nr:intermembrane transport protein PqiB [Halieaceae bacterium]